MNRNSITSSKSSHWGAKQSDASAFKEYNASSNIGIGYGDDARPKECNPIGIKHKRKKEDEAYETLLYGDAGSAPKSGTNKSI